MTGDTNSLHQDAVLAAVSPMCGPLVQGGVTGRGENRPTCTLTTRVLNEAGEVCVDTTAAACSLSLRIAEERKLG